jgi:hypothetical protein
LDVGAAIYTCDGDEETPAQLIAVSRDHVDLFARIAPLELPSGGATTRIAPNHHDVSVERCRLALDSEKTPAGVEDQVIAFVCDHSKDAYAQAHRCTSDCTFGDRALLIC